jgi:peptidyl-prolyl cis-trans isomerase B (cyclophilin B)
METDKGTMRIELHPERAPQTVANFVRLARQGFYDGLTFHRVIRDFMIQGGCPKGDGTGGPGYTIPAEFNDLAHEKGVISMARSADPDSAGSQFFLVHAAQAAHLDGAYTGFGRVVEGFDVLDALANIPVEWHGSERSRPREKPVLGAVRIVEEEIPPPPAADGEGEEG